MRPGERGNVSTKLLVLLQENISVLPRCHVYFFFNLFITPFSELDAWLKTIKDLKVVFT